LDQFINRSFGANGRSQKSPTGGEDSILATTLFQPSVMIEFSRLTPVRLPFGRQIVRHDRLGGLLHEYSWAA
jgi:hypothetical protein